MKVYLLKSTTDCDYNCEEVCGVYSSREMAIASIPFHRDTLDESDIHEVEVDPPNIGDRHEMFFRVMAYSDKSTGDYGGGQHKLTAAEADEIYFGIGHGESRGFTAAYGRTREEAASRAIAALSLLHPVWQVGRYINAPEKFNEIRLAVPQNVCRWDDTPYAVHEDLPTARAILLEYESTGNVLPGLVLPSASAKE